MARRVVMSQLECSSKKSANAILLKPRRIDYLLVLMLICLSGNLALSSGTRYDVLLICGLGVACFRLAQLNRWRSKTIALLTVAYLAFFLIQSLLLNHFAATTITGVLVRMLLGACVVASVRWFRIVFVHTMVRLVKLSLIIHMFVFIGGLGGVRLYELFRPIAAIVGAVNTGVNERVNIIVHNFMGGDQFMRNAGIFWEPGAFSGYIIVSILLLATLQSDLPKEVSRKWTVVFIFGVISTFSTTGYLMLPFALSAFPLASPEKQNASLRKTVWFFGFLIISVPLIFYLWRLDFVGPKLTELYFRAAHRDAGWELSRFGAAIFDWSYIQERPLMGWGKSNATQFSLDPGLEEMRLGNGLSGYLRQMGSIGLGMFVIMLGLGLNRVGVRFWAGFWITLIIVIQLNGQYYMDYPLFLSLQFLALERRPKLYNTYLVNPAKFGGNPPPPVTKNYASSFQQTIELGN